MTGIGKSLEERGLPKEAVAFVLGALIYPKHMLKIYEPDLKVSASGASCNIQDPKSVVLRKKIKRHWSSEGKKII